MHKAAKELGYRVNYLARSLINQRSDLVGVVAAGLDNPFRTHADRAICAGRCSRATSARSCCRPRKRSDTSDVIGQLLHYAVSGVIVTSDAPPTALCEECADHGVPIVLINKGDDIPLVDRVVSDDKAADISRPTHLIEGGARGRR